MVLIIIHFLIQVFRVRMTLVFDSLSMTQGLLPHLALDKPAKCHERGQARTQSFHVLARAPIAYPVASWKRRD